MHYIHLSAANTCLNPTNPEEVRYLFTCATTVFRSPLVVLPIENYE